MFQKYSSFLIAMAVSVFANSAWSGISIRDEVVPLNVTGIDPWVIPDDLVVGGLDFGELNIDAGSVVEVATGSSYLGYGSFSRGTINISGIWSELVTENNLYAGYQGNGKIFADKYAKLSNNNSYLGYGKNSVGRISLETGSDWQNSSAYIGYEGQGFVSLNDRVKAVNHGEVSLGELTGSSGEILIAGYASEWSVAASLWIGRAGTGIVDIAEGAKLISGSTHIGRYSGARGIVSVSGTDSQWILNRHVVVGNNGYGQISVTDGAVMRSVFAQTIGANEGAVGKLSLRNGGVSETLSNAPIGVNAEAVGSVTVSGVGTKWLISKNLIVGHSGVGNLTISNGGLVAVGEKLTVDLDQDGDSAIFIRLGGQLAINGDYSTSVNDFLANIEGSGKVNYWTGEDWITFSGESSFNELSETSLPPVFSLDDTTVSSESIMPIYNLVYQEDGDYAGYTILTIGSVPEPSSMLVYLIFIVAVKRQRDTPESGCRC